MTRCEQTGKVAYPSPQDAHKVRREMKKGHKSLKVYRCKACRAWHLAGTR